MSRISSTINTRKKKKKKKKRTTTAHLEQVNEIMKGASSVQNIFHNQHVGALDVLSQVHDNLNRQAHLERERERERENEVSTFTAPLVVPSYEDTAMNSVR